MAQVIRLPIQRTASAARSTARSARSTARSLGWLTGWDIDDWGRDDTLAGVAGAPRRTCAGMRRSAAPRPLPKRGPALIVVNSRRFALAPWFVALALSQRTGRPVRFVGRPDTAPFGALGPAPRRAARPPRRGAPARCAHGQVLVVGATGHAA